jgi:hypothetical protein
MNLICGTYNFYERREYAFNVLPEYSIIGGEPMCLENSIEMHGTG